MTKLEIDGKTMLLPDEGKVLRSRDGKIRCDIHAVMLGLIKDPVTGMIVADSALNYEDKNPNED